ncbi:hypothetical protein LTR85_000158 [Meristemomyces frigidus]|nr:hypothetical protein LTR85_000158 [Meristemomyces frigidus]
MTSLLNVFNRFLPFATPGTPVVQDLLHLLAICGLLYYAPHIQDWVQRRRVGEVDRDQDIGQEGEPVPNDGDEAPEDQHNDAGDAAIDAGEPREAAGVPEHEAQQPQPANIDEAAQAGPAHAVNIPTHRNVGAKKAKSMARRDQRRAYHEFQRSQGEAQRALDAEGAAEREAALAAERERRRVAEAALIAKNAREREQKREAERREREEEIRRREQAVGIVKRDLEETRMCDLFKVAKQAGGDVDEEWVEKILKAGGVIGRKGDVMTMITSMGWVVRVSEEDMAKLYRAALEREKDSEDGQVGFDALGSMLEVYLREQAAASA